MKYEILSYSHTSFLEEEVNKKLDDGWELVGGVSVAQSNDGLDFDMTFAQAMIKHETSKEQ